jgi:4-hydroxyphenylpyruvate dioxygenase-like putative hemolysin
MLETRSEEVAPSGVEFDHIGYAVANIADYLETFFVPLYRPVDVSPTIEDPGLGVRIAFVTLAAGVRIELIEPLSEASPVSKFVGDRRGGLYHLCYATDDLEGEIARFRSRGCMPFSGPTPARAFEGRRVAFLYTPQRDIVELVETTRRP